MLIGAIGVETKSNDGFTSGSGYTALSAAGSGQGGPDPTTHISIDPEYEVVSTAQAYAANATLPNSRLWAAAIATYSTWRSRLDAAPPEQARLQRAV